jgi:hypothetical protein
MKTFFVRCVGVLCSIAIVSFANPLMPPNLPVLSEIQVTDSLHWNVEVDLSKYPSSYLWITYPCETDTFKLFCWQSSYTPPADSMRRPVIHEQFDSKGIGVLTPSHFPGLKLKKNWYVFLEMKDEINRTSYIWQAQIPYNLTAQQSLIGSTEQYCCEYDTNGRCVMNCTRPAYSISTRPTIGLPNSAASIIPAKNPVVTTGSVRLLPSKLYLKIVLAVSGATADQGSVELFSAEGSLIRTLSFPCRGTGTYTVRWDGNNVAGRPIPPGSYACRVKIGEGVSCKGFVVR